MFILIAWLLGHLSRPFYFSNHPYNPDCPEGDSPAYTAWMDSKSAQGWIYWQLNNAICWLVRAHLAPFNRTLFANETTNRQLYACKPTDTAQIDAIFADLMQGLAYEHSNHLSESHGQGI